MARLARHTLSAAGLGLIAATLQVAACRAPQTVFGILRDKESGRPIPGAQIFLERGARLFHAATVTDQRGRYRFGAVAPGEYWISARKPGYRSRYVDREKTLRRYERVAIVSLHRSTRIDLELAPSSFVAGKVLDADGKPVHPSYVYFDLVGINGGAFALTTAPSGNYRAEDLPEGQYRLSARRYSAEVGQVVGDTWFYPGTLVAAEARPVALGTSSVSGIDISFGQPRRPVVIATVRGENGEPVVGAVLEFLRRVGTDWRSEAVPYFTGPDGRREVSDLPDGEYRVSTLSVPRPYAPWINPNASVPLPERAFQAAVVRDGQALPLEFRLRRGLSIKGRCRWEGAGPQPAQMRVVISMTTSLDFPSSSPKSFGTVVEPEKDASFRFEGLLPGVTYRLGSTPVADGKHCVTAAAISGQPLRVPEISLTGGESEALELEVGVTDAAAIWGRSDCASILARREGSPGLLAPESSFAFIDRGLYAIRGLTPGTYQVSCQDRLGQASIVVTLRAGEEKQLDIGTPKTDSR